MDILQSFTASFKFFFLRHPSTVGHFVRNFRTFYHECDALKNWLVVKCLRFVHIQTGYLYFSAALSSGDTNLG